MDENRAVFENLIDISMAPWWAVFLLKFQDERFTHTPGWHVVMVWKQLFGKRYFMRAYVIFKVFFAGGGTDE